MYSTCAPAFLPNSYYVDSVHYVLYIVYHFCGLVLISYTKRSLGSRLVLNKHFVVCQSGLFCLHSHVLTHA